MGAKVVHRTAPRRPRGHEEIRDRNVPQVVIVLPGSSGDGLGALALVLILAAAVSTASAVARGSES
jgi:hypothetical protein